MADFFTKIAAFMSSGPSLRKTVEFLRHLWEEHPALMSGVNLLCGSLLVHFVYKSRSNQQLQAKLKKLVEQNKIKRKRNYEELTAQLGEPEMTEEEQRIVSLHMKELVQSMTSRTIKCIDVLKAYQKQALKVTERLNCVTEFILNAQEKAKELDNHSDPKALPLYGLPISVKLNVAVKGHLQSIGMVNDMYNSESNGNAVLVEALERAGAVPFCITNIPQALFSIRCSNPLYGETLNPVDITRSPGGSSGGDGALVGDRGALLALGTDVAGSVRIPAAFCGTVSFKPTGGRLSGLGISKSMKGAQGLISSPGFQSLQVNTIKNTFKALTLSNPAYSMRSKDITVVPVPFNEDLYKTGRKLRLGYNYGLDAIVKATPVVKRAVDETVEKLKEKGHTLIRWEYPNVDKIQELILGFAFADGKKQHGKLLESDIVEDFQKSDFAIVKLPLLVRKFLSWVLKYTSKYEMVPYFKVRELSAGELWKLMYDRDLCIQEMAESWMENKLDAVISPALPCPAMKLDNAGKASLTGQYTCMYNMLDFPAGTVPVTHVTEEDVKAIEGFPTHLPLLAHMVQSAPGSENLPVEVQVAALRWRDEMVLRVMKEIEKSTGS